MRLLRTITEPFRQIVWDILDREIRRHFRLPMVPLWIHFRSTFPICQRRSGHIRIIVPDAELELGGPRFGNPIPGNPWERRAPARHLPKAPEAKHPQPRVTRLNHPEQSPRAGKSEIRNPKSEIDDAMGDGIPNS